MANLVEGIHQAEFLISEANGYISREVVTVTQSGTALKSGTLLGKITATGKYVPYSNAASNGSEVVAGVLYNELVAATGDIKATAIVRHAEVRKTSLTGWDSAGNTDLAAIGILVR